MRGPASMAESDWRLGRMPSIKKDNTVYQLFAVTTPSGQPLEITEGLSVPAHDHVTLGYTTGNLTSVVYRTGGAGGTVVATLTLAYDGSGNLISVTKS